MPLANEIPKIQVDIEGLLPDGTPYKDTYTLKGALGFYDTNNLLLAGMTVDDLRYFNKDKNGVADKEDKGKLSAGTMVAERDFLILKTWLAGWSHSAPLTDENIREVPPDHVKVIIDKIKSIGEDARLRPFRGGSGDEELSSADNSQQDNHKHGDIHPQGAREQGPKLANDLFSAGQADSV